jgi:hypothetical protein
MILPHNAAVFIHTFNHRPGRIRRDLQELRAEKIHGVSQVIEGMANWYHCIATGFMNSPGKLEHVREGRRDVVGTIESDFISAFVD